MIIDIFFLLIGTLMLYFGADWIVRSSVSIAKKSNIAPIIIGLTIVAFGTSLPELATSVVAAFKKEIDISLGNILGSNIFNILCVLGISSMISQLDSPIQMMNREVYFLFILGFLLIAISKMNQPISRVSSAILLIIYFYFIYLLF